MRDIKWFVRVLSEHFSQRLVSIGLHTLGVTSFLNKNGIFVVLDRVNIHDMLLVKEAYNKIKKNYTNPMVVRESFFKETSEIFCMELLELKENSHILHGINPFKGIEVSSESLRRQIIYEIHSKNMALKGAFVDLPIDKKVIEDVAYRSLYSFLLIIRNIMRLRGKLINDASLIEEFEKEFNVALKGFKALRDSPSMGFDRLFKTFKIYLNEVEEIASNIDRFIH